MKWTLLHNLTTSCGMLRRRAPQHSRIRSPSQAVEVENHWQRGAQCRHCGMQALGTSNLEALERLPPEQSGGDQDALLQAIGGKGDSPAFRWSSGRAASARCHLEPLQHAGPSLYGGCSVNPFGERGALPCSGFMQQRRYETKPYGPYNQTE